MVKSPRATGSAGQSTIVDVAREAGVSIKTVSRVVNKEPGVQDATRDRVRAAMQRLSYRPQLSARSLAGAKSWLIGLLYYDPSASFIAGVQRGATLRCREAGYHLVVESLSSNGALLLQQVEHMVAALRPDGMILTPPLCDNPQVLQALRASGTRLVQISPERDLPDCASVRMDDRRAAEEMTDLLIGLGHRRIAFICGAQDQAASRLREEGYRNALRAHGLEADPDLIQPGEFVFRSGVSAAHKLLSLRRRPTAVFAANDDSALGVLAAAHQLGLQVPGELSIAGFDDSAASSLVWPPLTTVRQPLEAMAQRAVQLLVEPAGEATQHDVLPYELLVRASTSVPSLRGLA